MRLFQLRELTTHWYKTMSAFEQISSDHEELKRFTATYYTGNKISRPYQALVTDLLGNTYNAHTFAIILWEVIHGK